MFPYRQGSKSAAALAEGLGGRVLKVENSAFEATSNDIIINWGSSKCPHTVPRVLNQVDRVARAGNKLTAFVALQAENVSIPRFAPAKSHVAWEGLTVVRHKLTGHSGEGIELSDAGSLPDAPLYVKYIKKEHEFRVHVIGNTVVAVQRKARNKAVDNPNWQVRNHANGFIFVRTGFDTPSEVLGQSRAALAALGLDFGAVDVIWNDNEKRAYVLEVNTAPGLEGQTIEDYVNGFREFLS